MPHALTETRSKELLGAFGVPVAEGREVDSPEAAVALGADVGLPVVLKVSHPDIAHKTDVGGVVLGVSTAEDLARETRRLLALAEGARVRVERQAPGGGVDLICGMRRDPVFGPVVMVGFGGIYAEVLADVSLHAGEPDHEEARRMLERLKGWPLLAGARGREPLCLPAVEHVLVCLGSLSRERPDVSEVDVNPLRVYRDGALALDALVLVSDETASLPHRDEVDPDEADPPDPMRVGVLFAPAGVAVVGASRTTRKAGNIIIDNLGTLGYRGAVYPVNPAGGTIDGLTAYPTVADCPSPMDLAVLAVPYQQVFPVMDDVVRAGVRHVIIVSGGFSDAGPLGREREAVLADLCRRHGVNLMGPNSIGTLDSRSGFTTSIGRLPPVPRTGVSVFGQSGTLSTGFALEETTARGRGFAKVACMGNKADIDECDFLRFLADDPDTRCVGLYLEAVGDGPRFFRAARYAAERKPVVVLKSGRTGLGATAAASHTGALAGSDAVYDAIFRQTGLLRVETFDELFGVLRAFDLCPLPAGNCIGVVSISGVGCVLAADACEKHGMGLAPLSAETRRRLRALAPEWASIGNPADIWSTIEQRGPAEAYREIGKVLIEDDGVDILLVVGVLLEEGAFDTAEVVADIRSRAPGKPVLACHQGGRQDLLQAFQRGLESIGVPVYRGPAEAVRAASALSCRAQLRSASSPW